MKCPLDYIARGVGPSVVWVMSTFKLVGPWVKPPSKYLVKSIAFT